MCALHAQSKYDAFLMPPRFVVCAWSHVCVCVCVPKENMKGRENRRQRSFTYFVRRKTPHTHTQTLQSTFQKKKEVEKRGRRQCTSL
jgi:hypothetical protein